MSAGELADDRATVAALDAAVAAFRAALGGSADDLYRARQAVDAAMLRCLFRAAAIRGRQGTEG